MRGGVSVRVGPLEVEPGGEDVHAAARRRPRPRHDRSKRPRGAAREKGGRGRGAGMFTVIVGWPSLHNSVIHLPVVNILCVLFWDHAR